MKPAHIQQNRLYGDLAYLWPLVSPVEEYAAEARCWRDVLRDRLGPGRHRVLELGVGGGHHLSHLTADFETTAVDLSEAMMRHSRRLNPGVEHIVGDMRTIRLGRTFQAVLIHDAVSHMQTEADLKATFATAAAHLEPGGVFITSPDHFRETFRDPFVDSTTHSDGETELTFIEFACAPDPADTTVETILFYLIRKGGELRIELDRLTTGLFARQRWLDLMAEAGFEVECCRRELNGADAQPDLLVGTLRGPAT
ncbi:class I SAM-dependent methyltransferase [Anaerobaca lacustris]|uniref:Class I SAM-dependent methyltransferase n=1 Tax=Anaerobaca lacustris TaxID=3044600 RepID=A0AAW6TY53_9BACT|nr:class I SAM-dependent methyltransferase [Sedimentisphaerales bacterium M17dextr]